LKLHHGWYYVKSTPEPPFDKGYIGWIDKGDLFRVDSAGLASYDAVRKLMVTTILTTMRTSPGGGETVSDLAMADLLRPVSASGSYFKVELPDGRTGYVDKSDVQYVDVYMASQKATPQGIEKYAKEFLGFPYLWGGTSSKAMDCSGFVKTVYRMNGIDLPRDASQQAEIGESVDPGKDFSELVKGDLLFFGEKPTPERSAKIVHVGIYLGKGYFIHSSSLVRINSLDSTDTLFDHFDYNRFVEARRILGYGK
jgi:gamma-D-glutamyl-L-lysine dipeptidyl-peptidase